MRIEINISNFSKEKKAYIVVNDLYKVIVTE